VCLSPDQTQARGWHEQDAEDWWRSTITTLRGVAAAVHTRQIGAIGLTHQRETFVCVGEDGRRNVSSWSPTRSAPLVYQMSAEAKRGIFCPLEG
jgi:xylulokinase